MEDKDEATSVPYGKLGADEVILLPEQSIFVFSAIIVNFLSDFINTLFSGFICTFLRTWHCLQVRPSVWRRYADSFKRREESGTGSVPGTDDSENPGKVPVDASEMGLKRNLTNRHIQMIAFVSMTTHDALLNWKIKTQLFQSENISLCFIRGKGLTD